MESDSAEQVRPQNCFSSKLLAAIKDFSAGLQIVVDDWQFSGRLPHFLPLLVESWQTTFEVNWPLGQLEQLEILSKQGEVLNMLNLRDHVSLNFRKQDIFQLVHRNAFWRDFLFYLFKCGPMPWFWRILLILCEAKFVFQQCSFTLVSRECNVTRVLFDKVLAEMRPGQLAGNGNSAIKQRSETADWGDNG